LRKILKAGNHGYRAHLSSTGYGYIKYDKEKAMPAGNKMAYEAVEFVEKPSIPKAKKYLESGNYLWNSGMFVWKTSVILKKL